VIKAIRDRITKTHKWTWTKIVILSIASTVILLNSMNTKSPFIGIPASLVVFYISSVTTSEIFFPYEKRFLKQALGLATFVLIMALLGTFLILIVKFTETLSLISLTALSLILCLLSMFKKREDVQSISTKSKSSESEQRESYLLILPFLLSVGIAFFGLLLGRTGEGVVSVWLTIPNFFLPTFFLSSLSLLVILSFAKISVGLKLALILLYSFLSHSLFLIIWYPGRYGDPWSYLGHARYIDSTGTFFDFNWLYSRGLIIDIMKYRAQSALVVFFRRMFTLDIYWIHVFFTPLLWSMFVPIFFYKIAKLLAVKNTTRIPLFCAFGASLFSTLIYFGAISTTYSLGLLFLVFSIMLLLEWVKSRAKRILFLSFLASIASLFVHPQTGVFALSFFFVGSIAQSRLHRMLKLLSLILTFAVYPYVSYLQGATFSQTGLLSLENFLSFQLDMTTPLLVFGFLGLLFSIKGKFVKGRSALLLFLFYVSVAVNYYVSLYGMKDAPVPQRIVTIADLLLVPFVVVGFMVTVDFLKYGFSRVMANPPKKVARSRSVALLLVCLFSSVLVTSALYQAYPHQEITEVQPAAYELEAILYIDSISEGRYVVLGDTNLATLAGGFLGIDYSYGSKGHQTYAKGDFGMPEWSWWNKILYQKMILNPSLSLLDEAMMKAEVGISYFVVSVREPHYEDIVQRTSVELQVNRTFGEGKLAVFRFSSGTFPVTGYGPVIKVAFDNGPFTEVQTEYDYRSKSEVNYIVKLSGYSSYNITNYPAYWTFYDLFVGGFSAPFDVSSDVNAFIYIAGLEPDDVLEVFWRANDHYPHAEWKEDSFKYNWQRHPGYAESKLSPIITNDGNLLRIAGNFTPHKGEYAFYYQSKIVNNISTNDFPSVLVKWRSTGPVASVIVAYTDTYESQIVPYGSESSNWTVTIAQLKPDREIAYVIVGITNGPDFSVEGPQNLFVDYILICARE